MDKDYDPQSGYYLDDRNQPPYEDFDPQPSRWRRVVRMLIFLIFVLLLAAIAFIFYSLTQISSRPVTLNTLATDREGRANILLLGVGNEGHEGAELSDTNMVMILDTQNKRVATISLPRDLRVQIPGYGFAKINQANALGGDALAARTVSNTLAIPIHYTITTNFSGLADLVDAVGGIKVNVKERLVDPEYPCENNQYRSCGLDIQPGEQQMDGATALKYVRCRKGTCGNDFGRAERQQEVIGLIREKVLANETILNPYRATRVSSALRNNMETTMGPSEMAHFGFVWQQAQKNSPRTLVLSTAPEGYLVQAFGSSDLLPRGGTYTQIRRAVANIFEEETQPTFR